MSPNYAQTMAEAFEDELKKIAEAKIAGLTPSQMKTLGLVGAGALGFETIRRANQDRRMGRVMRMQQGY